MKVEWIPGIPSHRITLDHHDLCQILRNDADVDADAYK